MVNGDCLPIEGLVITIGIRLSYVLIRSSVSAFVYAYVFGSPLSSRGVIISKMSSSSNCVIFAMPNGLCGAS